MNASIKKPTVIPLQTTPGFRVLFVCSGNHSTVPAFIQEQKEGLEEQGISVDLFQIKGRGVGGYLSNYRALVKTIRAHRYNLVHAHFGLSGLLANLQRKIPVVTTFHGCDLNNRKNRRFSLLAAKLSRKSIVVSGNMAVFLHEKTAKDVIPCGVDMHLFIPMNKAAAREKLRAKMQFDPGIKYILFSSTFDRDVKNPALAKEAVARLGKGHELMELQNFSRQEVVWMMNAADAVLMTSRTEGSPQFIKEAMACSRPIVTTNVGDVEEIIGNTAGCFIVPPLADKIAACLQKTFDFEKTTGRETLGNRYNNDVLISRIIQLYTNL